LECFSLAVDDHDKPGFMGGAGRDRQLSKPVLRRLELYNGGLGGCCSADTPAIYLLSAPTGRIDQDQRSEVGYEWMPVDHPEVMAAADRATSNSSFPPTRFDSMNPAPPASEEREWIASGTALFRSMRASD
jgi:hypothetical protein